MMKKITAILCALCLMAGAAGCACADSIQGQAMPEFTAELTDGTTVTLSELLRTREVVVLNLFATWCGPCQGEFPEMEAVYQQYKDKMEIVALSAYEGDDMETLRQFKKEMGLSFPVGQAGPDIINNVEIPGYPTSLIIDRNGNVAYYGVGAFVNGEAFEEMITRLMGDEYTGKQLWLYAVFVADQMGELVTNANIQCCTDTLCEVRNTGDAGFAYVVAETPTEYHVKILSVPEGYSLYDNEEENEAVIPGTESGWFQLNVYKRSW